MKKRKYPLTVLVITIGLLLVILFSLKLDNDSNYFIPQLFLSIGLIAIILILIKLLIMRILANKGKTSIKNNYIYEQIIFLIIISVFILQSIYICAHDIIIISSEKTINAEVVNLKKDYIYIEEGVLHTNIITVKYNINNEEYTEQINSMILNPNIGSMIKIYYNPNNYSDISTTFGLTEDIIVFVFFNICIYFSITTIKKIRNA